jgi:ribosomal protein S2
MEDNKTLQQQLLEAGVHFGHLKKNGTRKCCHTFSLKRMAFI